MFAEFDMEEEAPGELVVVSESDDGEATFTTVARSLGPIHTLAVGARTWAEAVIHLLAALGSPRLLSAEGLVNQLRRIKSPEELKVMPRAAAICDGTMAAVTGKVRAGVTLEELVKEVEYEMRSRGSLTPSFTTHIFTGGQQDALESRGPSALRPLRDGEAVLFGFGGVLGGCCSHLRRTDFLGVPTAAYLRPCAPPLRAPEGGGAYAARLAAQEAGGAAAGPGVSCADVNRACREPIEDAGYGPYFRHRMGHCIGLDVHERPFISEEDETPLQAGMLFTDEPS